jgi:hypothetical protein
VALHEAVGVERVALAERPGYKHEAWHGVGH